MAKKRTKKTSNENKLMYVPFIVLAVIIVLLVALPYIHFPTSSTTVAEASTPLFNLVKINNINYAGNNTVQIYFISWYGCPNGATTSWPLYLALSKFGYVNVTPHYSITESTVGAPIPGLIFSNFTHFKGENIYFHPVYIYGQYLNETPNGTPISSKDLVTYGLQELKNLVPYWVYNLTEFYEVNQTYQALQGQSPAYASNIPHLITILIISGPGGTWMVMGYPAQISPTDLAGLNSTILYNIITGHQSASGEYSIAYNHIENASIVIYDAIVKASS